jgi:hypothetical protein
MPKSGRSRQHTSAANTAYLGGIGVVQQQPLAGPRRIAGRLHLHGQHADHEGRWTASAFRLHQQQGARAQCQPLRAHLFAIAEKGRTSTKAM